MALLSPIVIWTSLVLLGLGGFLSSSRPYKSRIFLSVGWLTFGLYWATMAPHYLYAQDSIIEASLCVIALPVSTYAGWISYTQGLDAIATVGKGIATMGLIYFPVEQTEFLRRPLMEVVAVKTVWAVESVFDHNLVIQEGPIYGYQTGIAAPNAPGGLLLTHIELACTGLGSIAIIVGLISVLDEPVLHRVLAASVATAVIYILNVVRTVFITSAYVGQWFQFFVSEVLTFTGYSDPRVTSFFIADKVISQSLSVLVLLGLFWIGLRIFPSLSILLNDILTVIQPEK